MLRRSDAFGLAGMVMLLTGVALFFTGSTTRVSWWYWMGGPFLWFAGFAFLAGWIVWRWTGPDQSKK